jgi:hypothetical protein
MLKVEDSLLAKANSCWTCLGPNGLPVIAYLPPPEYGFKEGLPLAVEFSVEQARAIGKELLRLADLAKESVWLT